MTRDDNSSAPGEYLYAIIDGASEGNLDVTGIDGAGVRTISDGQLSAVVSETALTRIRAKRRFVAAHQEVLQKTMNHHTVLPVSFGVIADHADAVRAMLTRHRDELRGELATIHDKVEMTLRVMWDVPNVFQYLVHRHAELRELRDRLWGEGVQPSREQMIEVGRSFERFLAQERDHAHAAVTRILERAGATEFDRKELTEEREVLNLACLVPRRRQEAFEKAILDAANRFDQNHSFDYSGPWPAYSFVKLNIQLAQLVEAA